MDINEFANKFASQFEDVEKMEVNADTKFRDLPTWDSMTAMCVQAMVLDDYNVVLSDQDFKFMSTLKEVFDFVLAKRNDAGLS
jgi:acyl carrier protein